MSSHVLVAYATKHGTTRGIADCIAEELRAAGLDVSIGACDEIRDVVPYDAVVLGSALYMDRWRGEAVSFVRRHGLELAERPLWLFSSGPLGEEIEAADLPMTQPVARAIAGLHPIDHETFRGALLEGTPGIFERLMARSRSGDYRDWDAIRAWARDIARHLGVRAGSAPTVGATIIG